MDKMKDVLNGFEWHNIPPGNQFFDALEKRLFMNVTDQPLKIGFGHNTRRVEMIAIGKGETEDPELEALKGKVVTEE